MDKVILTPRLELILQQSIDIESDEVKDYHLLRCDPGATSWSFGGVAKDIQESQQVLIKNHFPIKDHDNDVRQYRASYNVYLRGDTTTKAPQGRDSSRFIGRVGALEGRVYGPPFSPDLVIPDDILANEKALKLEVGYSFLEKSWGHGYASEALKALMAAYQNANSLWNPPYEKVYFMGILGPANVRSSRVLEKVGFRLKGIHSWDGPKHFLGGAMQPNEVAVYSLDPSLGKREESQAGDERV
ncbi:hypothetical protein BT63DRAFT_423681 [Microthyrium microscopicum]|uniref:N-acetyltransferase domain-containing protein n=1 Tax=Microthyrium microscopicum TaxID=703497 RepID=A0A6A6UIW0_9PEZI|nr:hypothetical protein BT63DRAFT_423681 [Microthyrium microscopicum]